MAKPPCVPRTPALSLTMLFELLNTVMPYHGSIRRTARSIIRATLGTLLLAAAPLAAWPATDPGFLHDTPLGHLDQQDIDALDSTIRVVLNTRNDGETSRWTNRGSGTPTEIDATLTPEGTTIKHRKTCRFVVVTVRAKGKSIRLRPRYCQTADASWALQKQN
jgi:hypothetical protein